MDTKKKLTKTVIDNLTPSTTDTWIWDTDLPGFGVRCTPAGRKTYVARYRTKAGVQRKQVIARTCDMPPDKARDLARKVFAQVAEGADPMAERKAARPTPKSADTSKSVGAMFQAYADFMKAKGRASAKEVERALLLAKNNAADALGRDEPASSVTPGQVVDFVSTFYQAGHRGAADKARSYIHSAYAWAIVSANDYTVSERRDWGISRNPAAEVAKDDGANSTRDRNLDASELRKLWQATKPGSAGFSLEVAVCIRMLIACGQRVQETLRIEGCEIDLQDRLWKMPAHKTKGGKYPHTIPLPKQVINDLKMLISVHGQGPLFPARTGSTNELIHHSSVLQAIERWYATAEVAAFQTRDLRRTWKSRAHDAGVDRFTRDLIQQHAKGDTGSKHYDRAEYLPQMRQAMTKWSEWIKKNLDEPGPDLKLVA